MSSDSPASTKIPRDALAPPGISGDLLTVQSHAAMPEHVSRARIEDNEEREFEVFCVLSRDTRFAGGIAGHVDADAGTSFLLVPDGKTGLAVKMTDGEYRFLTNPSRELSCVVHSRRARSVQEAKTAFLRGIGPALDHLAYMADVPLTISHTVAVDRKNLVTSLSYTSPYQPVTVEPGLAPTRSEMAAVYGLYREAKNASSPIYRFVCYYKILEGIFNKLRPETNKRARAQKVTLTQDKECIPDHPELRQLHKDLIGRPIKVYFDKVLTPLRHAAAHFLVEDSVLVNPSDPEAFATFVNAICPLELACRVVIDRQERTYEELEADAASRSVGAV